MSYVIAVLIGLLGLSVPGCDSEDPYQDAPSATAEQAASDQQPDRDQSERRQSPSTSGELPPDHPPVNQGSEAEGPAGQQQPAPTNAAPNSGSNNETGAPPRESSPLTWELPDDWTAVEPSTQMRLAEYRIPGADDANSASLGVFHFGQRGGGDVQSNIERWVGQFSAPNGGSADADVTRESTAGGTLTVHRVDVSGTYEPGVGMGGGQARENQRMLAAIVESPSGRFFFKLVGPKQTVGAATAEFDQLIESLGYAE